MSQGTLVERGSVTLREELMPGVWLLRLHSPRVAAAGLPGQFVHISCGAGSDPLLRRPFSFADIDAAAGTYDIIFNVVGEGTAIFAAAEAGQMFEALGPLGRPFTMPQSGTLVTVGGGLGIAPFPLVAREAARRRLRLVWLNGAYTANQLYPVDRLPDGVEVHLATDDGTAGTRGYITDVLTDVLEEGATVHACGPTPMLVSLARVLTGHRSSSAVRAEVSLEAPMGCALGTCLGCVVPSTDGGYARVCVEGAVMDWRSVDWARYADLGELIHHRRPPLRPAASAVAGGR